MTHWLLAELSLSTYKNTRPMICYYFSTSPFSIDLSCSIFLVNPDQLFLHHFSYWCPTFLTHSTNCPNLYLRLLSLGASTDSSFTSQSLTTPTFFFSATACPSFLLLTLSLLLLSFANPLPTPHFFPSPSSYFCFIYLLRVYFFLSQPLSAPPLFFFGLYLLLLSVSLPLPTSLF